MTELLQICLWVFVGTVIIEKVSPSIDILKKKAKYKKAAKMYMLLSKAADSDYKAGFFYGKSKLFEQKARNCNE